MPPSAELMADGLTKLLIYAKHQEFVRQISLVNIEERLRRKKINALEKEEKIDEELEALPDIDCHLDLRVGLVRGNWPQNTKNFVFTTVHATNDGFIAGGVCQTEGQ